MASSMSPRHGLEVEALVVPRLVRVAEELERLVVAGLRDLLLVDHGARAREELVAADVVDVQVRVDERRHVRRARSRRPRAAPGSSAPASARAARRAARDSCDRGRCRCRRGTARRRARPARCRRGCAPAGPATFQSSCVCSITIEPLSSSQTFMTRAPSARRRACARARARSSVDPLGRVVVEALARSSCRARRARRGR